MISRHTTEPNLGRGANLRVRILVLLALFSTTARADEAPKSKPMPRIEDFAPPHEFVVTRGFKTHYVAQGPEAGRPIVFVHGFGSCTYTWRLNLPALAAKGFRVYAIDVKGFGLSEKPRESEYHLASFTRQLLDFLDVMKLDRPILVGNSMGGAIVTRLALSHPERVRGIVLVDAAPPSFDLQGAPGRLLRDEGKDQGKPETLSLLQNRFGTALARTLITRNAIAKGLRGAYHDPKFVTEEAIDIYFRAFTIDGAVEAFLAMVAQALPKNENLPSLDTLKVPALIVWGRFDAVIPVSMADRFAHDLPSAKKVILEKSGHMPHEEEADAFNALLVEFATAHSNSK